MTDREESANPSPDEVYCEYWRRNVSRDHCKHFPDEGCAGGCPGPHRDRKN